MNSKSALNSQKSMDVVHEFITRYRKEYDFYEQSCRIVAQILDSNLQSAGIRAIVTSRAKNPTRLQEKVRQRAIKTSYTTVEEIYEDIVDLAGVRVALYFPGEREDVGKLIKRLFQLVADEKIFPIKGEPTYKKRFSGYWATHYRIRVPESNLNEVQKRYSESRVEIQVASVLMHAWSEVEHDLVYKPLQGALSDEEYAILDELNGLVLAGEIALERLQRAGELRASTHGRQFTTHYDLAASLLDLAREHLTDENVSDSAIGRVDVLFELLRATKLNTPDELAKYVRVLHSDFELRPLSEQIVDQVLAEDPTRYSIYKSLGHLDNLSFTFLAENSSSNAQNQAIGEFLTLWIEYENRLRLLTNTDSRSAIGFSPMRLIQQLQLSNEVIAFAERLRRFRNQLVHGIEVPDAQTINAATADLHELLHTLTPLPSQSKSRKAPSKRGTASKISAP